MDINKHPIYRAIYELGCQIENLPASEQQTKLAVMCSNLQAPADLLYQRALEAEKEVARLKSVYVMINNAYEFAAKERDQLQSQLTAAQKERDEAQQSVDCISNLIANCGDTLRSRGFKTGPLDERVIGMAQALDAAQKEVERLSRHIEVEKANQPFYKEISAEFEKALGPHPKYENGCWIKRVEELREQLTQANAAIAVKDEALKRLSECDIHLDHILPAYSCNCHDIKEQAISITPESAKELLRDKERLDWLVNYNGDYIPDSPLDQRHGGAA